MRLHADVGAVAARIAAVGLAALFLSLTAAPAAAAVTPRFSLSGNEGAAPAAAFSLVPDRAVGSTPAKGAAVSSGAMPKKWRRFFVQEGIIAAYSTYRYWKAYHEWVEDWQFELTFADQYRRFLTTEAIRFDSNAYVTNWTHVIGGVLYYQMARTNYLTWAESLAASFTASAFYEYVSEWREVISINDMALTTFGGYSVGETFFQLTDYFHHRRSFLLKGLGFLNPINTFNQWLDRKDPASRAYPEPGLADLVLSVGWWGARETGRGRTDAGLFSFESELLRIPEYGRPGTVKKVQRDTTLSQIDITVALKPRSASDTALRSGLDQEVDLYARTVGLSWYDQSIDALGRGTALSIGIGSALDYVRKRPTVYDSRSVQVHIAPLPETPTDFRDKMTIAHMLGPVVDYTIFGRGVKVRAVADAYFDFAMINAFAFNAYSAVLPIEGMKTTLAYYGYYYGYGLSSSARVDVNWGRLAVRGLVSGHAWGSWQGRDRFQDEITNNIGATDTRSRYFLRAAWRFGRAPVRVFAGIEGIHRRGKIGEVKAASQETRTFAGLSYLF